MIDTDLLECAVFELMAKIASECALSIKYNVKYGHRMKWLVANRGS